MPRYGWKAVYEDCTIRQFPLTGGETSFKEVEDRGLPIRFFIGNSYGVNLQTGEFLMRGSWVSVGDVNGESFVPEGLIYFRRNTVDVELGTGRATHTIKHFVGYVYRVEIDDIVQVKVVRLCIPDSRSNQPVLCIGDELPEAEKQPVWRK